MSTSSFPIMIFSVIASTKARLTSRESLSQFAQRSRASSEETSLGGEAHFQYVELRLDPRQLVLELVAALGQWLVRRPKSSAVRRSSM